MSIRLRDQVTLLEPATKSDPYTEEPVPDWTQDPVPHDARFYGHPVSTQEAVLTAQTIVSRWQGFLGPEWDGIAQPDWRVRWDGDDYEIEGAVERHKTRRCVRYLTVLLKRVDD